MTGSHPFLSFLLNLQIDDERSEQKFEDLIPEVSSKMFLVPTAHKPLQIHRVLLVTYN